MDLGTRDTESMVQNLVYIKLWKRYFVRRIKLELCEVFSVEHLGLLCKSDRLQLLKQFIIGCSVFYSRRDLNKIFWFKRTETLRSSFKANVNCCYTKKKASSQTLVKIKKLSCKQLRTYKSHTQAKNILNNASGNRVFVYFLDSHLIMTNKIPHPFLFRFSKKTEYLCSVFFLLFGQFSLIEIIIFNKTFFDHI